ncbi:MAG: zinc-ribbon domain-containing protein [Promethearchaeota archaeon]|nr:MAG: zinc-ribbon domain-containing protein [Candidatus Lokiarchaeota archaeon]
MMPIPPPGTPIIIDIGSAYVKIGFAGEPKPRFVFPCITGTEKYKSIMVDVGARSVYVGNDAMRMRGVLKVKYPIQRGVIMDWNEFYEILNHIFYTLLRIENLSYYPIIYVEHPFVPRETKEYIARVFFETHRVRSLIMMDSPILSSFSVGRTTGLVIESGDGVTWIVPIINGQIHHAAVQKLNLAGIDVNHNLKSLLMREGINIESSAAEEIIKEIKEKNCYFVLDPTNPPMITENFTYPMPDGSVKEIPNHIFYEAPEVMFQPSMLGYNTMNIPQAIIYSLQMVSNEYWHDLLSHIIISGGNLSYSGFDERLKQELNALLPQLGPIPKPKKKNLTQDQDSEKLRSLQSIEKIKDTCPECGAFVDLSDGTTHCPECGADMNVPQIAIDLGKSLEKQDIKKSENICPSCKKKLKDITSVFCPYCGKRIKEEKLPKSADGIIEKSLFAKEFGGENDSNELINLDIPDNLQYAIFNGASILGSLPSFQALFVTYEEFQVNPDLLYQDISDIFNI